jgi:acyl-coenzyme A thioesterase PaaI-like protein
MATAIQDTYPEDFSHCFGCGRNNKHGHQIKTFAESDHTVTEFEPAPYYLGGGPVAYGGVIASIIDCHCAGTAAIAWMQARDLRVGEDESPRFVTARLEVDYAKPTPIGPWRITGYVEELGERKVIVAAELWAGGEITARGRAVMVRIPAP